MAAVVVQRRVRGAQTRSKVAQLKTDGAAEAYTRQNQPVAEGQSQNTGEPVGDTSAQPVPPDLRTINEVHEELEKSGQSSTFSLSNNVARGDTRAVDPAYATIQRIASERNISFDEARLLYTQQKNLEAGE